MIKFRVLVILMNVIKKRQFTVVLLLFISAALAFLFFNFTHKSDSYTPRKNYDKKWRIGYYEGGPWIDYQGNLKGIIHGLMALGWIERAELPNFSEDADTSRFWNWLSDNIESDFIYFVSDAYWSSAWKNHLREKSRAAALERLANRKDIDLMIAAGTWAGQDMADEKHMVPTIVISASDPIQSGIINRVLRIQALTIFSPKPIRKDTFGNLDFSTRLLSLND